MESKSTKRRLAVIKKEGKNPIALSGGQSLLKKRGKKHFSKIGTLGNKIRWANHKKKSKKD